MPSHLQISMPSSHSVFFFSSSLSFHLVFCLNISPMLSVMLNSPKAYCPIVKEGISVINDSLAFITVFRNQMYILHQDFLVTCAFLRGTNCRRKRWQIGVILYPNTDHVIAFLKCRVRRILRVHPRQRIIIT